MKKQFHPFNCIIFFIMLVCFPQCQKEQKNLNITLYDKPPSVIESYIQGMWKCCYGKGGISANTIQYYEDYFWTFIQDNRIQQTIDGMSIADGTIQWVKEIGTYINVDSTFVLTFVDNENVPWNYVVDGIFDDTLILHDNTADAVFYHFSRR